MKKILFAVLMVYFFVPSIQAKGLIMDVTYNMVDRFCSTGEKPLDDSGSNFKVVEITFQSNGIYALSTSKFKLEKPYKYTGNQLTFYREIIKSQIKQPNGEVEAFKPKQSDSTSRTVYSVATVRSNKDHVVLISTILPEELQSVCAEGEHIVTILKPKK